MWARARSSLWKCHPLRFEWLQRAKRVPCRHILVLFGILQQRKMRISLPFAGEPGLVHALCLPRIQRRVSSGWRGSSLQRAAIATSHAAAAVSSFASAIQASTVAPSAVNVAIAAAAIIAAVIAAVAAAVNLSIATSVNLAIATTKRAAHCAVGRPSTATAAAALAAAAVSLAVSAANHTTTAVGLAIAAPKHLAFAATKRPSGGLPCGAQRVLGQSTRRAQPRQDVQLGLPTQLGARRLWVRGI